MNKAQAELALKKAGYVVDIGQIDPDAAKFLRAEARAGRIEKVRAPYAGLLNDKTHYVADRARFDAHQLNSRTCLLACAKADDAIRQRSMAR